MLHHIRTLIIISSCALYSGIHAASSQDPITDDQTTDGQGTAYIVLPEVNQPKQVTVSIGIMNVCREVLFDDATSIAAIRNVVAHAEGIYPTLLMLHKIEESQLSLTGRTLINLDPGKTCAVYNIQDGDTLYGSINPIRTT